MSDTTDKVIENSSTSRFLGFFTVMLILTLNASNGKDLLDVMIPYIEAKTLEISK